MRNSRGLGTSLLLGLIVGWLGPVWHGHGAAGSVRVTGLRCEYQAEPLAVQTARPRLSWRLEAPDRLRGVRQTAWQVLVASREDLLKRDVGDLWDSGKVAGDETLHIEYGGRPLRTAQTVFWKVRAWDQEGRPTPWSEPARWTMGVLDPGDWRAQWIGFDADALLEPWQARLEESLKLEGAVWIWLPGAKPGEQPPGDAFFRKRFETLPGQSVRRAVMVVTADDAFTLFVNGQEAGHGSNWRTLATLDVTDRIRPGTNILAIRARNGGANPTPAGLVGRLVVVYESGATQVIPVDGTWRSGPRAPEGWATAADDPADWQAAAEVGRFGEAPWGQVQRTESGMGPAVYLRKSFVVGRPIRRAVLFASALGVYELHVNGQTPDRDVLSPGWTDYHKRVHYRGYDVTALLRRGENVLGAILGDGWYASYLAFTGRRHYYGDRPRFLAQLHIEYGDGSTEVVVTDGSWKAAHGPIREADLLMGCVYDARLEMPGWDRPRFKDEGWQPVTVDRRVQVLLTAHPGPPIRRVEEIRALKVTEPRPGVYIFDLGQNMVGWVRLQARGRPGQKVVVRHGEMLNPDGTLYTENLRAARATDTYYLAGSRRRAYEPYFTFHGFRYVEVTGLEERPLPSDVTGIVVHSDLARASAFECSEPLVNRLVLNTLWSQKGNFLDVPTDCPQRDERAGWTGDAQVFMKTACYNMDAPAFFTKWLVDLCEDSQREDGAFGDVAPHINVVGFGNTGWADAGPICNWQMWRMYGDVRVLERHYPALQRYMQFLERTSTNHVRGTGAYGDWLRLAGPQHSEVIGTAYYFYTTRVMAEIASALGRTNDAARYAQLAGQIGGTFVQRFIREDGRIVDGRGETGQTFYALAFGLGLVPDNLKERVARAFVKTVEEQNWHLATGFLGTPLVLFALEKAGHPELAWRMVLNKTYPSWLQQVLWGATSMWERWDGWTPERGFQDPGMNSFNHYWLGCVGEWLYSRAAGIDTEGPAFKTMRIRPLIPRSSEGLEWVQAHYDSIRGRIESRWRRQGERVELEVVVPPNTTALVHVPARSPDDVREGGRPLTQAPGISVVDRSGDEVILQVGSGRYRFTSRL
ncbi:family 78 glycoside hydrolase catalytic domain [Limisphaera ngatamarikiensis]|uniref:alpha-L-rhamnosidase n=1 Tax=Limisphaera ngatamarikiensis TaxID=1324935 RepID=A0A6M1RVX3_9BACT|nr:family 78 glycoside hydrolase catalytic domain [Limisphaera ngatamarikiensis]NGO39541.1 family 78 glycoside hydrolase catalytic domain [Limisphaera ngatamarikiensis]